MEFRIAELWTQSVWKQLKSHDVYVVHAEPTTPIMSPESPTVVVTRGFAETLYLPTLADLCEREQRECVQCRGHGHIWQMPPFEPIFKIGSREDIRPLPEPVRIQCEACHGTRYAPGDYTSKPTQLALDTMRAHPTITRVVVGDRRPLAGTQFCTGDFEEIVGDRLPRWIFDEIVKIGTAEIHQSNSMAVANFQANQAALDALAVAAGQWLRLYPKGESSE